MKKVVKKTRLCVSPHTLGQLVCCMFLYSLLVLNMIQTEKSQAIPAPRNGADRNPDHA